MQSLSSVDVFDRKKLLFNYYKYMDVRGKNIYNDFNGCKIAGYCFGIWKKQKANLKNYGGKYAK